MKSELWLLAPPDLIAGFVVRKVEMGVLAVGHSFRILRVRLRRTFDMTESESSIIFAILEVLRRR